VGVACEFDEAAATSPGVGEGAAFGGTTGVAATFGDATGEGDGVGVGFNFGETAGVGPVLLSGPDGFWRLGELAGSAATPGRVNAHHIKGTNNIFRRIRQSRLVISRREQVRRSSF
jgi:hypothetical protein